MSRFSSILLVSACSVALSLSCLAQDDAPYLVVLGIGQDAGVPQAGSFDHPAWKDLTRRETATSLGVIDPATGRYWVFDATPDFRTQWYELFTLTGKAALRFPAGVFLTHAHIGHYAGLMFLGHESAGAQEVPVFAMPRMQEYLSNNGPWSQLVAYNNITFVDIANRKVDISEEVSVQAIEVPHRQEFSEVVGYIIDGPTRRVLFIPDIDSWTDLDSSGVAIEDLIADVDVAFLDGTFYVNGEIPGRDMSAFPHPFITHSMSRFDGLSPVEKAKIRFIHLNHSNPALDKSSDAYKEVQRRGFRIAKVGDRIAL